MINFFTPQTMTLLQTGLSIAGQSSSVTRLKSAGDLQADVFRTAGASAQALANYNIGLDRLQARQQIDTLSRNLQRSLGRQSGDVIASGISSQSKSAMLLRNELLDAFDREILNVINNQAIVADQRRFNAQMQQVDFENRARAARFGAELQTNLARQQQAKSFQSVANQGVSLLGDING